MGQREYEVILICVKIMSRTWSSLLYSEMREALYEHH